MRTLKNSIVRFVTATLAVSIIASLAAAQDAERFDKFVKPLLAEHCQRCHNVDQITSGVRVDQWTDLASAQDERFLKLWQAISHQLSARKMPPEDEPQPADDARQATIAWIEGLVHQALSRPSPKNGLTRRLTVAQYRNTLAELLGLREDLTDILPPDAVSRDGFLNNKETLQLSPLLLESYFQIASQALDRVLVQAETRPKVQIFQVDFGRRINPEPCPDELILGANNHLLRNEDFVVRELQPGNPHFDPLVMQKQFRFIEGYAGNDTVRGWREYDSIYHAVFACMRGSEGYPKGHAYNMVTGGLLLRPAIPSVEEFQVESTYGPKANFKLSLRELPDHGNFRVTVLASKYDDALLLDKDDARPADKPADIIVNHPEQEQELAVKSAGIYRLDIISQADEHRTIQLDASRLAEQRWGHWSFDEAQDGQPAVAAGKLEEQAHWGESPFGRALSLDGQGDAFVVPRQDDYRVGTGDFTVAAWIHPGQLQQAGIVSLGKYNWTHGWYLDMPDNQGRIRLETANAQTASNGTVVSPPGVIVAGQWQHVAAVVKRGENAARIYVNGHVVAKGTIGPADLDNLGIDVHIGRIASGAGFQGRIDEVSIHSRALEPAEIEALVEPGRRFARAPTLPPQDITIEMDDREFSSPLEQSALAVMRLGEGTHRLKATYAGAASIERIELTRLSEGLLAERFLAFERRAPKLGVHLGLRRDCGSTLSRVGTIQEVSSNRRQEYVFEGAINDFPSPDVEKDNVNYLAGLREIGVRSEYTDGRDMPRLQLHSIKFEGPLYDNWPPAEHSRIMLPRQPEESDDAYAQRVISQFAVRAWRRPLVEREVQLLVNVYARSRAEGSAFQQSLQDALQVVLTSPQFLFLIESSRGPEPERLDEFELASKLAYFLWNGPPDQALILAAERGELYTQLDQQLDRMLADPRAQRFTSQFVTQWLALDKFQVLEPDRQRFPKLTPHFRAQLAEEPIRYLEYLLSHNLPISNLIESDFIVANEVVANYYGLGERLESGYQFVPLEAQRRDLGGVITQAAILAGLSDGRQANPIKRGAWLARRIIAEPPDDPPPNVPNLKQETEHLPLRERLEMHRNQAGCAQCHAQIDPYGIPLEEYDAGGRRQSDAVDARSQLPDAAQISGADDLKRYLAHDRIDQVAFSFLKHLTVYACGRDLTYYELEIIRQQSAPLKAQGYRVQDMLRWVVHSPMFLEK